jgi:hypothetical protein
MKLLNKLPPPSKSDKRILGASVLIFLAACVIAVLAINARRAPNPITAIDINGNAVDAPIGTLVPGVAGSSDLINQMTALPSAAPLTGPLADDVHAVAQMVTNCNDYSAARRQQMNQNIAWLLQPNLLPKDMVIALGNNINGRLILGMATFTLSDWGQKKKAADSCLLPIGKKLNDMLAANGEARVKEFDGA